MESMMLKMRAKRRLLPSPTPIDDQDGDDRISALDDELRERILRLAHLNVRELVRTSMLSKRWRGLWKRVSALDFFGWPELKSPGAVQRYIAIVNNVLEQRSGAIMKAPINEVKIPLLLEAYSLHYQREQLLTPAMEAAEAWIRYAMHHQVKGFQLDLCMLPFTTKWPVMDLDELLPSPPKLECMRLGIRRVEVRLPRTAVFTSLKELTLEFLRLAEGSAPLLARLSSSVCCPTLQKLRMVRVSFERAATKELVLDAGKLLELSMEGVEGMELLELTTPNLLYLHIKEFTDLESLIISAPGLKELTYFQNRGLVYGPLLCLWRLKIDLSTHKRKKDRKKDENSSDDLSTHKRKKDCKKDENSSNICLVKHCSSSVRYLLVHLDVPMVDERSIDLIKDNMPELPNVTSLLVSIAVECQRHSFGDGVASLLTRFKNLEYLSLQLDCLPNMSDKTDEYQYEYNSEDDEDEDFSLTCNHSDHWESSDISLANLHVADFKGMTGTGCELRFLRFVLRNATGLQSVTVGFNLYFVQEEEHDSRMHYILHTLLGDGTWTACKNEDQDLDEQHESKLYKWTPCP